MRKDQLTPEQAHERALVVQRLVAAGWKDEDEAQAFDQGHDLPYEAQLSHVGAMTLEVKYLAPQRAIDLWLGSLGFLEGRRLRLKCPEELSRLLEVIVGFQDHISPDTFREHVRPLLRLCPETYAVVGGEDEERLVRVVDEKEKG